MNVPFFVIGLLSFIFFWLRKPAEPTIGRTALFFLFLSTFFIVLTTGSGILGQLSAGFHALAVGCMLSVMIRTFVTKTKREHPYLRRAAIAAVIIIVILTIHNVAHLGRLLSAEKDSAIQVANPWGIVILLTIIVFTLHTKFSLDDPQQYKNLRRIVLIISMLFIFIDLLVLVGILTGNTQKVSEGIGGRGLANISTNETGILGVSLLLWNLVFLFHEKKMYFLHALAGAGNFGMIVFAKSRVALGLALVLLVSYLFFSTLKAKVKVAIFLPALIFVLLVAGSVIQERTLSEGEGDPTNPLTELPGSGRPVIWFYYLDAFMYTAESNPLQWLTGVGVMGLVDLYELTPLESLRLTLEKVSFYPLHSEVVKVFLISGFVGFMAWLLIPYYLIRIPKQKKYRFQAVGAITVFSIFTSVDMLNYFPLATILLMLAVASAVDRTKEIESGTADSAVTAGSI